MNRDHARAALSVYQVALHRDDLDDVEAMASAIQTYLALAQREAEELDSHRARVGVEIPHYFPQRREERRTRVRLSLRQVVAIQKALR